jgi:phage terminase large subunit
MAREIALEGTPNPKQVEFFTANAPHIAYGGSRAGGKSWAMRRKFVLLACHYENLKLLLLRRTLPELRENHEIPLLKELAGFAKFNKAEHTFSFPNGSRIVLGYCDAENDVYQYQGQEYDVVGLEEATQFTEAQMQFIKTCNRSIRPDFTPRMYYTCNPGGVGHNWVKRLFIDRDYKNGENPDDYVFIPASIYDNRVFMDNNPQYIDNLKTLPTHLRKAHLEGDWNVVDGQYYEEFELARHVIEPFPIPEYWKRFRAMDWGYNDPCAVLWFAVSPDKHLYVYREIYQNKTNAAVMADLICERSDGEDISYTVASPDMWQKRGASDVMGGESIAETFLANGVPLIKADNNRISGWQRIRECLVDAPDGVPWLQIFSTCRNLIRTLPALYYDENDHEDVSDRCEDHAAESLRYGLMSRPAPKIITVKQKKEHRFDPFSTGKKPPENGFFDL